MGYSQVFQAAVALYGVERQVSGAQDVKEETQKQVTAQKEQQKQSKRLADIKAQRERRKLVQEGLAAKSKALVAAGEQGADSRSAGVLGSIQTKVGSGVSFAGQQEQIAQSIFEQGQIATSASAGIAAAQSQIQIGGAAVSAASSAKNIFRV